MYATEDARLPSRIGTFQRALKMGAVALVATMLTAAPALADGHGGHGGSFGHSGFPGHAAGGFAHTADGHAFHGGGYHGGWGHGYAYGGWGRPGWGGWWGHRVYAPAFYGFGYYYDPYIAWPFLGLAAWELSDYAYLNEADVRAQENAMAEATSAPLSVPITWADGATSGSVTPVREGHTDDGRICREFQQQVTIAGKRQQAFGTACRQPDGSWQIVSEDSPS